MNAPALVVFCLFGIMESYPNSKLLIEPTELGPARATFPRLIILDVRDPKKYKNEHINEARSVDPTKWAKAFKDSPEIGSWTKLIRELRIGPNSTVVLYDDTNNKDAARIWWILRYWGIEDARLLNGGWPAWKAAALPTSSDDSR